MQRRGRAVNEIVREKSETIFEKNERLIFIINFKFKNKKLFLKTDNVRPSEINKTLCM